MTRQSLTAQWRDVTLLEWGELPGAQSWAIGADGEGEHPSLRMVPRSCAGLRAFNLARMVGMP